MLNLHKSNLRHNSRLRLFLLSIAGLLVFACSFVTLQRPARADSDRPLAAAAKSARANSIKSQDTQPDTAENPAEVGKFSGVIQLPLVPVHLSVLPDQRVLFWGRDKSLTADESVVNEVEKKSEAYVWDVPAWNAPDNGSNKTDVAVFRPSEGVWYIINSSTGTVKGVGWGSSGDIPVPGDYDGDGRADIAVYNTSNGTWYIIKSSNPTGPPMVIGWGIPGDRPAPGDYNGDGKTDAAVFRPTQGTWYIRFSDSEAFATTWGTVGDIPVPGDYDGDGKTDVAVFRPSEGVWYIIRSTFGPRTILFGTSGDIPVPGNYVGDANWEPAVYRPSTGTWKVKRLLGGVVEDYAGFSPTDVPSPGDYDGDGKTDVALFRASQGTWFIRHSSDGIIRSTMWGLSGDVPVAGDFDGMLRVANTTTNLFCSGHSFLPDGRLFVTGGHKTLDSEGVGETKTNIFNYKDNSWSSGPVMDKGRWYPYNVMLNTGETLIMSGSYWSNEPTKPRQLSMNLVPEAYTAQNSLRSLNAPETLTFYPYVHLTPDGKVFQTQSGPFNENPPAGTPIENGHSGSRLFDPSENGGSGGWHDLGGGNTIKPHANGTSVLFDQGRKVLLVGGFDDTTVPTKDAEFIDLTASQPTWTLVREMDAPRAFHTATILPDGKVLVSGGVRCPGGNNVDCDPKRDPIKGAAMNPELWDPAACLVNTSCQVPPANCPPDLAQITWKKMAQQKEVRAYHSIAALLPDGRVLIGGGGLPGAVGEPDDNGTPILLGDEPYAKIFGHKNVEVYSPPYLFTSNGQHVDTVPGARPVITTEPPQSITYGQSFFLGTSAAGSCPQISLVRLSSVTHGFNQDQRQMFLTATVNGSGLNVTAPAHPNVCPPGYYMLFVLNSNRVPSVAKIVKLCGSTMITWQVPAASASGAGATWEQGAQFSSSVNGQITHIRFYKHSSETGTHVGRIWSDTGTLLASVTFTNETSSGWQEQRLSAPLQITAGIRFRVTYNINLFVAKTFSGLESPITNGPLTALTSFFSTPAGSFPTSPSQSNLFADVRFCPNEQ